jgi:hypothetical protein
LTRALSRCSRGTVADADAEAVHELAAIAAQLYGYFSPAQKARFGSVVDVSWWRPDR